MIIDDTQKVEIRMVKMEEFLGMGVKFYYLS